MCARLAESADYAERATQRARQIGNQVAVDQSLLQRARIYRDLHQLDRCQAMLDEVEPRLKRALPPGHYAFASLDNEKALLALARGNLPQALELSNQGVTILEASIKAGGQGESALPTLLKHRSTIELAAGHANLAVADATRAMSLLQPYVENGGYSSRAGWAYLAEARGLVCPGEVGGITCGRALGRRATDEGSWGRSSGYARGPRTCRAGRPLQVETFVGGISNSLVVFAPGISL